MSEYLWATDTPAPHPSDPQRAMSSSSSSEPAVAVAVVVVESDPAVRSRLAMQLGERAVPVEGIDGVEER